MKFYSYFYIFITLLVYFPNIEFPIRCIFFSVSLSVSDSGGEGGWEKQPF